jgi:hypothetical protein
LTRLRIIMPKALWQATLLTLRATVEAQRLAVTVKMSARAYA